MAFDIRPFRAPDLVVVSGKLALGGRQVVNGMEAVA